MGKFKSGLQASQKLSPENQDSGKPENHFSGEDMKPVNVGGFKVPLVVREHWVTSAKQKRTSLTKLLREFLVEQLGLPEGITEEDL